MRRAAAVPGRPDPARRGVRNGWSSDLRRLPFRTGLTRRAAASGMAGAYLGSLGVNRRPAGDAAAQIVRWSAAGLRRPAGARQSALWGPGKGYRVAPPCPPARPIRPAAWRRRRRRGGGGTGNPHSAATKWLLSVRRPRSPYLHGWRIDGRYARPRAPWRGGGGRGTQGKLRPWDV